MTTQIAVDIIPPPPRQIKTSIFRRPLYRENLVYSKDIIKKDDRNSEWPPECVFSRFFFSRKIIFSGIVYPCMHAT